MVSSSKITSVYGWGGVGETIVIKPIIINGGQLQLQLRMVLIAVAFNGRLFYDCAPAAVICGPLVCLRRWTFKQ